MLIIQYFFVPSDPAPALGGHNRSFGSLLAAAPVRSGHMLIKLDRGNYLFSAATHRGRKEESDHG